MGPAMRKRVFRHLRTAKRSAQSDQGLLVRKHSLDTAEYMNGKQRPGGYFAHAQDDLTLRIFAHVRMHFFA